MNLFETNIRQFLPGGRSVRARVGNLTLISHHGGIEDFSRSENELAIRVQLAMHGIRETLTKDCIDLVGYDC